MELKELVKEKYGQAALRVNTGGSSCCGAWAALDTCCDPITSNLYDAAQTGELPEKALKASLGCGNPTALAQLNPGETVLDLGSGGGIDVLLSARRVGPAGKAYGLDMTDEMLALALENQRKAGLENVEFLRGEIEHIPLPDNSVDVIISNCVINLSGDKDQVFREAFRVLKPGGRFAVSDVVTKGEVPEEVRKSMLLWVGCIAGALQDSEYIARLARAGFDNIDVEPTRAYDVEDARAFLSGQGLDVEAIAPQVEGKFISAFIRATKPANCCAPGCCAMTAARCHSPEAASDPGGRRKLNPQLTAFFTSAPIFASSAAVSSFSAKAVGHMWPSSSFALSLKPSVAYLVLNFCALWKKQTTLPSLAYAGIPYQVFGERAGALALMIVCNRSAMARSGCRSAAIFASTALSPSALPAPAPRCASFNSWTRSLIAARSSSVNPMRSFSVAVVLLADFCVPFFAGFIVLSFPTRVSTCMDTSAVFCANIAFSSPLS